MKNKFFCQKCLEKGIEKEAEHCHHEDGNHKNNDPKNLKYLCAICHAEIHGISANTSEIKKFVILRDRTMKRRMLLESQIKNLSAVELIVPEEFSIELGILEEKLKESNKQLKTFLKENLNETKLSKFLYSKKGIDDITIAKILAYLPKEKRSKPAMRRYWGLDPSRMKRKRGISKEQAKQYGVNYMKKELLGVLSDNFIMQKNEYKKVYDEEKAKRLELGYTKLHASNCGKRKMIQKFVDDIYDNWDTNESFWKNETTEVM